ncbi:AAA domain-containing protein [Thermophagus sp. OGC60D27]|uniref:AAA domain-containing protein n=1 Tax=Thermophagus sp. OGC60D27 TaxID=3458415 RepID=UPI0040378C93
MREAARRFFDELMAIDGDEAIPLPEKMKRLRASLEKSCRYLTRDEGLTFSNLFGRLNYVCNKMQIGETHKKRLHRFRIFTNKVIQGHLNPDEKDYTRGLKVLAEAYGAIFGTEVPQEVRHLYAGKEMAEESDQYYYINVKGFRCILLEKNTEKKQLLVQPDVEGDISPVVVLYNVHNVNEELTSSIELMTPGQQLQLLDTHRNNDGSVVPGFIVLEPDYLVDVTAVAKCFQNIQGKKIRAFELFFAGRAELRKLSKAIHKGNVANLFFDELINEPPDNQKNFDDILKESFRSFPLPYTSLSGIDKDYLDELKHQFINLRRVVDEEFLKGDYQPVSRTKSNLEVSLMSPELGLQGRMDLFDESPSENHHYISKIIELKSGKLPFPNNNPSVVAEDHSAQVRMYNMMAQRVLGYHPKKIFSAVLYSSASKSGEAVRYVDRYKSIEREIINVRNQIVAWEYRMASDKEPFPLFENFFQNIEVRKYGLDQTDKRFKWFFSKFTEYKKLILEKISPLERHYYFAFSSFIGREKILSKVGDGEYTKGLSALWNKTDLTDEDTFNELRNLRIKINKADLPEASITLSRPSDSNRFINFRRGDICVLYPHSSERSLATQHRVLKCSIERLTNEEVTVRLRQKQSSLHYFQRHELWGLEHDSLDNNFEQMQSGLVEFLKLPESRRNLLLGLKKPVCFGLSFKEFVPVHQKGFLEESRIEQNRVLFSAWNAKDYYLLVGPPGTGKTNLFLQRFVKELYHETALNILLVSYTNRAVDEMCSSVRGMVRDNMIRIGSKLGCDPQHEDLLLDRKINNLGSRQAIRHMIEETRLFAGTLSSILGKNELFELKKFDIAIVDEASQILEPNIIPLLGRVDRFVLIGDERQLPAVVTQPPVESAINDEHLHDIGLFDRRNSYFERLLWLCRKKGWDHAWGELTFQGRMHPELAQFPNCQFYGNKLKPAGLPHQKGALASVSFSDNDILSQWLRKRRMVFIPSAFFVRETSEKYNAIEAQVICLVLEQLIKIHGFRNAGEISDHVGIITPFRNQIASIREALEARGLDCFDSIQIDTVERYQGSQKDFILISLCMNSPSQLEFMAQSRVFFNEKTERGKMSVMVDRKLNVMLTRARKQIIITGNEAVLRYDEIYGRLIEHIREKGGYFKQGARFLIEG